LKDILKSISADYELGKKEFGEQKDSMGIMMMQERVCFIRESVMNGEPEGEESNDPESSSNNESEGLKGSENEPESSDDETGVETDLTQKETSEEEITNPESTSETTCNDQDEGEEANVEGTPVEKCVFSENTFEEVRKDVGAETSSENLSGDSDDSIYEKSYFISSAANIRQREMHNQPRYQEDSKNRTKKKGLKRMRKRTDQATLKDLQEEVKKGITRDDRA
jgi:hypothetical protein